MTERPTALSFVKAEATSPPFDSARLDALLDEAGIDALVISSKHNIQYLFGGYRFFFFDHFDAIGVSRYLPLLVYVKGRPDQSTYIGHAMESYEKDLGKFWTPAFQTARASLDSAQLAIDHLRKLGPQAKHVGIERAFLPADAAELMARELPGVADVRVLGAIGVVELKREVNVAAATAIAVERGVWLRPFRDLVYTMPAYVMKEEDVARVCQAMVAAAQVKKTRPRNA